MSPPALRPGHPLAWRAGSVLLAGGALYATYSLLSLSQHAHAESPETQAPAPAAAPRPVFSRFGPTTLRVQAVQEVNHNTKKLVLAYADPEARSGLQPISSLIALTHPPGRWLPLLRPYTPISDLDEKGHLTLLVKKYPHGRASGYLHALQPGDALTFLAARRGYHPPQKPNQFEHVYLLAGGAGITPCYQLIRSILQDPAETTKLTLLFGGNTEADLLLREELEAFVRRFPDRLRVVYTVSNIAAQSLITIPALLAPNPTNPTYHTPKTSLQIWKRINTASKTQNPPLAAGTAAAFVYLAWTVARAVEPPQLLQQVLGGGSRSMGGYASPGRWYAVAAGLTVGVVPFTAVVMRGTDCALLRLGEEREREKRGAEAEAERTSGLLRRWAVLNAVRSLLPLVGGLCGFAAAAI